MARPSGVYIKFRRGCDDGESHELNRTTTKCTKCGQTFLGYYWESRHPALDGGRVSKSLRTKDPETMMDRALALNRCLERGMVAPINAWALGERTIEELAYHVREGKWDKLQKSADTPTIGEAVKRAIESRARLDEGTIGTWRVRLGHIEKHFGSDRELHTVTSPEIRSFLNEPKDEATGDRWSYGTANNVRMAGRALWRDEIDRHKEIARVHDMTPVLTENPWDSVDIPQDTVDRPDTWSQDEWQSMMGELEGSDMALWMALGVYCGLRTSEASHLRVRDLILDGTTSPHIKIRVHRHPWREWTPKRRSRGEGKVVSSRDIHVGPAFTELVREHLRQGYHSGTGVDPDRLDGSWDAGEQGLGYLFPSYAKNGVDKVDAPMSRTKAYRFTERALTQASMTYGRDVRGGYTYYTGRHTFATWLLKMGYTPDQVAVQMGNSAEVIRSTYSHLLEEDTQDMMREFHRSVAEQATEHALNTEPEEVRKPL